MLWSDVTDGFSKHVSWAHTFPHRGSAARPLQRSRFLGRAWMGLAQAGSSTVAVAPAGRGSTASKPERLPKRGSVAHRGPGCSEAEAGCLQLHGHLRNLEVRGFPHITSPHVTGCVSIQDPSVLGTDIGKCWHCWQVILSRCPEVKMLL